MRAAQDCSESIIMNDTPHQMSELQQADIDIGIIWKKIHNGDSKHARDEVLAWSSDSKALWNQWDRMSVRNGVLCRRFEDADGKDKMGKLLCHMHYEKSCSV